MKISAQEWQVLSGLLDDLLTLPQAARMSWVTCLGAEHDALKPILHELLTRKDLGEGGRFLEELPRIGLFPKRARERAGTPNGRLRVTRRRRKHEGLGS
jgi:hypothetical protein